MKTYLYTIKLAHRRTEALAAITCGVIRAENETAALEALAARNGDNAYGLRLLDVTEQNGEAYIAIPSGMVMDLSPW